MFLLNVPYPIVSSCKQLSTVLVQYHASGSDFVFFLHIVQELLVNCLINGLIADNQTLLVLLLECHELYLIVL